MIALFTPGAEISALTFLGRHAQSVGLIAPQGELSMLPEEVYAPGAAHLTDTLSDVPVIRLDQETPAQLAAHEPGTRLWFVADSSDEPAALSRLRGACPDHQFAGVGEALLPAMIARKPQTLLTGAPQTACQQITLIFAPPRSGSSFVADVVSHVTGAQTREHLRNDVIQSMAAAYKFDRSAAMRAFLSLASSPDGQVSTKIISHFLQDYIGSAAGLGELREVFEGISFKVIIIERADKVAQAISGYLAARRGIWHLENEKQAAKLAASDEVSYQFDYLLPRYLGYRHQSYVLDFMREIFPEHLSLEYAHDIEDGDFAGLSNRIADFLDLPRPSTLPETTRSRLSNAENDRLCAQFRADYAALFGQPPGPRQ